jgi:tetratricopeptide (TPR) repeat protein
MNAYAQALLDAAYAAYRERRYGEAWTALNLVAGSGWRDALTSRFIAHLEDLRGNTEATVGWLATAIDLEPSSAAAHSQFADALCKSGRLVEAERAYRQAIERDRRLTEAYGGLARILHLLGRDDEAMQTAEQSLANPGDLAHACRILGTALVWLNRHEAAIVQFRAAQAAAPDDATARNHEGMALLSLGRYREGWPLYDARLSSAAVDSSFREWTQPMWRGDSDIRGRTILLHAEQGLGDSVQFVRYAPQVAARGAAVWLEVAPALKRLVTGLPGIAGVVAPGEPPPDFTLHCPLMSLPRAFNDELATIPRQVSYIQPYQHDAARWRRQLGTTSHRRIGVAWSGNPAHPDDRLRSIAMETLLPLLGRSDCEFHAVQNGVVSVPQEVRDHSAELVDLAETAALMQTLDLIIAVDSAPAHLAGAIGRPTWLLLQFSADWRWMRERSDSPWYPTMRLFRQPRPGDWDSVIADVSRALDEAFCVARG